MSEHLTVRCQLEMNPATFNYCGDYSTILPQHAEWLNHHHTINPKINTVRSHACGETPEPAYMQSPTSCGEKLR